MHTLFKACALLSALLPAIAAVAQTYPAKPVRIMTAFPPGGPTDLVGRAVGQKLQEALGQPFLVDYKPGGNATIGTDFVAKSPADGYMLLLIPPSHTTNPSTQKSLPYDTLKDFTGVSPLTRGLVVLITHPKLPANSVKELVALAKANPGKQNYASSGTGGSLHLGGELFKMVAGINAVHVAYKGAAPALTDVMAGTADWMFISAVPAMAQIKSGKVRLLAVASPKRSNNYPDIPAVAETFPKFEVGSNYGLIAPAATPRPVIGRLNGALEKILATPEIRKTFNGFGVEPWWDTPENFNAWVRDEVNKWAGVAKAINYVPE
jgi:tripartite-type tricarboxylate transporter receptor subunit TctC